MRFAKCCSSIGGDGSFSSGPEGGATGFGGVENMYRYVARKTMTVPGMTRKEKLTSKYSGER
jgi:hypothetical protein